MERETLVAFLQRLYQEHHTGPVILHFTQGYPKAAEMPLTSVTVSLDTGRDKVQELSSRPTRAT